MANCLVLTKVDADLAPSAEQWTAQGPFHAAIFIRQGWPQAMSHLSGFCTRACFPRIAPATCANDVPLETVADRSVPLACGPNVDQAIAWDQAARRAAPLRQLRKKPSTSSSNLRLWVLLTAWPTPS
jgi:hypothetical protein